VSDVLELAPAQIRPAPEFNSMLDAGYITGLGSVKSTEGEGETDRMLILIDIERLMSATDMALMERQAA
jgi:purine-binding chemotaxis protein CheW